MCSIGYNVVNIVGRGARIGIDECQHQFKMNRWNCSTYEEEDARVFGPVLDISMMIFVLFVQLFCSLIINLYQLYIFIYIIDSREKAFIHAISTAGVVYSITRACSRGEMSQCGCDETTRRSKNVQHNWEWGGCSDDIHYGAEFTKKFIDSVEDPTTPDGLVNLHNNEVGRRVCHSCMHYCLQFHFLNVSNLGY